MLGTSMKDWVKDWGACRFWERVWNQVTSHVVTARALFYALDVDLDTTSCFLACQEMIDGQRSKQKPVTNLLDSEHVPQLLSQ